MNNGAEDVFAIDTDTMSSFSGTIAGLQRTYNASVVQRLSTDFNALRDSGLFVSGLDSIKQVAESVDEALGQIVSFFQNEASKFSGEEDTGIRDAENYSPPFGDSSSSYSGNWGLTTNDGIISDGLASENPANFNIIDAMNGLTADKLLDFASFARLNSGVELVTLFTDPEYLTLMSELLIKYMGGRDSSVLDSISQNDLVLARANLLSIYMKNHPGELGITNLTVPVLGSLTSIVAADNSVDVSELLTNPSNAELLKSNLGILVDIRRTLTDTLSKIEVTDFQQAISNVYNGATDPVMPTKSLSLFREFIDNVAKRNNITAEELLLNNDKLNELAGSIQELNNFLGLGEYMTKLDSSNVQVVMNTLVSG